MKEMFSPSFSEFLRNIPEGSKQIHYSPGYLKITSNDGNVYVYKKVDGVYQSCAFKKNIPRKINSIPKTKRGKIKSKYISTIAALFAASTLIWTATKYINDNQPTEKQIEQQIPLPKETKITKEQNFQIIIENGQGSKIEQEFQNMEINETNKNIENNIIQTLPFEIMQSNEMQSRQVTKDLYGTTIAKYAEKYGLYSCLIEALITQERHKKTLDNPGQLTRNICGEEIIVPIIQKSTEDFQQNKEIEKIFIVRDEPQRENFDSEQDYMKQLNRYKQQLEKSKDLAANGYEIVYFSNLIGEQNAKENIRISIIWLTHCIYKCDCQINKGIFAYNQGYPTAKKYSDNEIMNGMAGESNADIWYNYNVFQFLTKEEALNMDFALKPFPNNWDYLTPEAKNNFLNNLSQTPVQNITFSIPIFNEYLEEKYTNEKENGYSL